MPLSRPAIAAGIFAAAILSIGSAVWFLQLRPIRQACDFSTLYQAEHLAGLHLTDTAGGHSRSTRRLFECFYASRRPDGRTDIVAVRVLRFEGSNQVMLVRDPLARRDLYLAPEYEAAIARRLAEPG